MRVVLEDAQVSWSVERCTSVLCNLSHVLSTHLLYDKQCQHLWQTLRYCGKNEMLLRNCSRLMPCECVQSFWSILFTFIIRQRIPWRTRARFYWSQRKQVDASAEHSLWHVHRPRLRRRALFSWDREVVDGVLPETLAGRFSSHFPNTVLKSYGSSAALALTSSIASSSSASSSVASVPSSVGGSTHVICSRGRPLASSSPAAGIST